uniref:NADH:flavin oxidoreductase/NADH oxidase N-terminal domain-containing protein n=1 Tax=Globisporangium ultimum (strain ATCC 200006 / CBS 805.95 / DAOM BR144) TaxID=431595 RepID=K3WR49_GLOUD
MTASIKDYKLFMPLTLAEGLTLKNRIVHGPLTRARSDAITRVPTEANAVYYEQRAGAGLIITEATAISPQGFGWYGAPALYNDEQAAAWRDIVQRVHKRDGKIFLQLWHMGRQCHPSLSPNGDVVSASANCYTEGRTRNDKGESVGFEMARALETNEIPGIVEDYRRCAERAKEVGFDGVEIHACGGYLVDLFLQSSTNQRTDQYGGLFENRARFLFEIVGALKTVWPADRIGVRIGPNGSYGGMGSEDNPEMFTYVLEQLSRSPLGYVAIQDGLGFGFTDKCRLTTAFDVKKAYKGMVLANVSYTRDIAEGAIRSGAVDFVGFGRLYMANPDLAERFLNDWPLNTELEYKYWWDANMGTEGYNTHPTYTPESA